MKISAFGQNNIASQQKKCVTECLTEKLRFSYADPFVRIPREYYASVTNCVALCLFYTHFTSFLHLSYFTTFLQHIYNINISIKHCFVLSYTLPSQCNLHKFLIYFLTNYIPKIQFFCRKFTFFGIKILCIFILQFNIFNYISELHLKFESLNTYC